MTLSERVQEHAFRRRWLILVVLCVSLLVIVLDNSILNVAIPTIVRELDASNSQVQWMVDSYTLVFAGLLLTMGSLGDRYGRRGALQIGFLVFGLGSLASALATSADQLIATRAFMGIGGALIMPATLSIITNVFPAQERGRAIGVWAGTAGVGVALGPLTGGFLLEHFYWGSIFLVNLPIVVLGLIAGFFLIPTSKDPSAPRLDPIGALLSIAGLTALLYAIIEAPNSGWTSPSTLTTFALGAGLLLVFGWWELNSDHPMLDLRFFENPRFSAANAAITLTFFAMFGSIFLLTQYLQFTLGYTPLEAGIRMLPYAITMMVVAPTSARVVERVGSKTTVATGLFLVTLALLLMTMLQVDTAYIDIAWRMVIMAAGLGLVMAPATDSVMGSLPLAKAGVGSAVNDTTRQVGGAMGVAIIGSVLSSVYGAKVADWFVSRPAPAGAKEAAKNSLGGAIAVADKLKGAKIAGADALAHGLTSTANQAFVDALHAGLFVAAAATFVGVLVVAKWLPAAARGADVRGQAAEFTAEHAADGQHPAPEPAPAPAGAPSGRPAPAPAAVPAMKAAPPARAKPAAAKAPAKKAATKAESPTANAPVKKTPSKKAAPRKARAKKAPAKVSEAANGAAAQKAALDGDGSANVEGSPNGAAAQQTPATADGSANGATPKPAVAPGESSEVGTP